MRLNSDAYWQVMLAMAWTDRRDIEAAADADLVRKYLSKPGKDLSATIKENEGVNDAYERTMRRARLIPNWRPFGMHGSRVDPRKVRAARLLYLRSPALRSIRTNPDRPRTMMKDLTRKMDAIRADLELFGGTPNGLGPLNMTSLFFALEHSGRLPLGWCKDHRIDIDLRKLYDQSPALQKIGAELASDPVALIKKLWEEKSGISNELSLGRKSTKGPEGHAIVMLVGVLDAAGVLGSGGQTTRRLASAFDLFTRSETLRGISTKDLAEDKDLMKFLLARRDRIAVEVMHARGKLGSNEFTFQGASSHFALCVLVEALFAGGLMDRTRLNRLVRTVASPLEYYLEHRTDFPEMDTIIRGSGRRTPNGAAGNLRLPWTENEKRHLSVEYAQRVIRWGRWFYQNPDVVTKSIYGADELPYLRMTRHGMAPLGELLPRHAAAALASAARFAKERPVAARREAFFRLRELVIRNIGTIEKLPEEDQTTILLVKRLVQWNSDALPVSGGGGGRSSATVSNIPAIPGVFSGTSQLFAARQPVTSALTFYGLN